MIVTREITVTVTNEVELSDDGQSIYVDRVILSGHNPTHPSAVEILESRAAKYLSAAAFLKEQREKDREKRILTLMYEAFNAYYGLPYNGKKYAAHIQGEDTTLSLDPKWRRVAETIVSLEGSKK